MIHEIGILLLQDEHDPIALDVAAEKVIERAMYREWYAIRIGKIVVVVPKEEGYEEGHEEHEDP